MNVTILMNTCFEKEAYLIEAIESCLAQKFVKVQLIISTIEADHNIPIIKQLYPFVELFITPLNAHPGRGAKGCYVQINNALHLVKGEYFHFISSNDILHPLKCWLETEMLRLNNKKVCYSNFWHFQSFVFPQYNRQQTLTTNVSQYNHALHLKQNFVSDASMIHKSLLDKYCPFDTNENNYAFWDLWLRIYKGEGNIFCLNPFPIFNYRQSNTSMHIERKTNAYFVEQDKKERAKMLSKYL